MNAQNTTGATIDVVMDGTLVPLPDNQSMNNFAADGAGTAFTVPETGTYLVTYRVSTTDDVLMTSEVLRNGNVLPGSAFSPAVSTSDYSAMVIASLTAGDTLELRLSGLLGAVVLQGGAGASMTVVRLA